MSGIRVNEWLHNSGTGGIWQTSAGNVGIASSVPTTKLEVTGDAKISGVCTATNFAPSSIPTSHRNLVINGAMKVAQRGTSFTSTGEEYTIDRWKHSVGSSFNFDSTTTQESSGPDGFGNSLKVTPDSAVTPSGGENAIIEQFIEGQNLQGLAWGTASAKDITISFYAKSAAQNANHQYTMWMQMYNSAANRFVQTKAFTVTASWQRFSLTFTGNTSENLINANTVGLRIGWILAAGPDDIMAAKTSWEDTNFWRAVTGQSNFMDNTSNEFYLTGVQLEAGSVTTAYEHRSYGDELLRCQRYYQVLVDAGGSGTEFSFGNATCYSSSSLHLVCPLSPEMRTTPTLDYTTGTDYYKAYQNGTNDAFDTWSLVGNSHPRCADLMASSGVSVTAGASGLMRTANTASKIAFTAEL